MNCRNAGLKERLQQQDILVAPGAPDALIAKIIEKNGFEAVYVTGGGISYTTLGKPDIGLITMSEMVQKASYIAEAVNVPVITDADTGYGNPLNVIRTVKEFERAGVSAIQLEDQVFPKRCGHMAGKALITKEEMVAKIKAAVDARNDKNFLIIARTDAIAVGSLEEAIERGIAYQDAGADVLFVEAPEEIEEMRRITDSFDIPQLANMVEGGKTPLLSAKELEQIGYKIVIFPNSAVRIMAKAVWELMQEIKTKGTTKHYTDNMFLFDQLNDLLDQNQFQQLDNKYSY